MYTICYWFLTFFIFSIIGYIAEVIFCYSGSGKITNRGFLHGPYCPIYGFGTLLIVNLIIPYKDDPIVLFILSIVFTSLLEYFTSWLMEKIFNNRWWDYSNNFGNINGRVCLFNSLCFGIGSLLIVYILYPLVSGFIIDLPYKILIIITIITFLIIISDFIITTNLAFRLKKELIIIKKYIEEIKIPKIEILDISLIKKLEKYKKIPNHFINAFPNIIKINFQEIKVLRKLFLKLKNKKKS